jgi:hypothetical protein
MTFWDRFRTEQWYLGHASYCCIGCGKKHHHEIRKVSDGVEWYTLDYCSDACMATSVQEPEWKKVQWKQSHLERSEWQSRWGALVKIGFTPENETTPKTRKR